MPKISSLFYAALLALVVVVGLGAPKPAYAQDDNDVYDPFIDYSEFEEAGQEEADINFFQNGRLFTAGFAVGERTFTEGMRNIWKDDTTFGLYLSYFFDLRLALQFSYMTGDYPLHVVVNSVDVNGDSKINSVGMDLKYYFNTQNVTKGLAAFNPYLIGGFSSISRESNVSGETEFSKETAMAFDIGAGFEVPILRNDYYMGAQALYQLANFKDENTQLTNTTVTPNGDFITYTFIIGANF